DRAPARDALADECPPQTHREVRREHVTEDHVDGLDLLLRLSAESERIVIEKQEAEGRQSEHAQKIDPVKPADDRVPDFVTDELGAGSLRFHGPTMHQTPARTSP